MTGAQRTLTGYLLLPRPKEAVAKVSFVLFGGLFAYLAFVDPMPLDRFLGRLALAVVVLDLLVYQGRYVLNDVRGAEADARHPGRRGLRFPVGADGRPRARDVRIAHWSVAFRLVLAVGAALTLWRGPGVELLLAACVVVLGVAVPYDALRERTATRARERFARSGSRPDDFLRADAATVGVYLLVGVGYAVRLLAGVAAGAPRPPGPALVVTATIGFAALGVVTATMTWVAESAYLLGLLPQGFGFTARLADYPHLGPLIAQSGHSVVRGEWAAPVDRMPPELLSARPLAEVRTLTWWTGAFVVSLSACTALGFVAYAESPPAVLAAALAAGLGGVLVVRSLPPFDVLAGLAVIAVEVAVLANAYGGRGVWGVVPPVGVLATYLVFRRFDVRSVSVDRPEIRRGSGTPEQRAEEAAQP